MDIKNRITLEEFSELIDNKRKFIVKIGKRSCGQLEMTPREFYILNGVLAQGSINMHGDFFEELEKMEE